MKAEFPFPIDALEEDISKPDISFFDDTPNSDEVVVESIFEEFNAPIKQEAPIQQIDLEQLKAEAFEEGEKSGIAKQKTLDDEFKKNIELSLNSISSQIISFHNEINQYKNSISVDFIELAKNIALKLLDDMQLDEKKEKIISFISSFLTNIDQNKVIIVVVNSKILDFIKPYFQSDSNFKNIQFEVDDALSDMDCNLKIDQSIIKKSLSELKIKIDELIATEVNNIQCLNGE